MASIGVVKRLVIHHSGGGSTVSEALAGRDRTTAAGIKKWHINNNGWSDIGYHKVIRGSGLLENGVSETTLGSHVKNGNTGALGVCCTGHFGLVKPTKEQLNTLVELLAGWCKTYKLTTADIYGHHNVPVGKKKPACPGKNMVAKFGWIKQQVADRIMPPRYVLSAKVQDPNIRRILERSLDDNQRLCVHEVHDIISWVVGDGVVSPQEMKDLKAIFAHSASLQGPGKGLLATFLLYPNAFIDHNRLVATAATPAATAQPSASSLSVTQKTNNEFYRRYPQKKGKQLTSSASDKKYRDEWMTIYRSFGGK